MKYRMYCLVLRQLSPINKGVQTAHACLEYSQKYFKNKDYQDYITNDKTLIMLDGGTSIDMNNIVSQLNQLDVNFTYFQEPDLGNLITAVCFVADERIWDKENYPSFMEYLTNTFDTHKSNIESEKIWVEMVGGKNNSELIRIIENKKLSM